MNSAKDNLYLIAANVFDQAKSRILEIILEASINECNEWDPAVFDASTTRLVDTIKARFNLTEFIGGGYEIVLCRKIHLPRMSRPQDDYDEVVILGSAENPEIFEVIEIIEEFPLIEGSLVPGIYQIGQLWNTFRAINNPANLSENYTESESGFTIREYKLICLPDKIEMRLVADNRPCPHLIGYLMRVNGDYEEQSLRDLSLNYKYKGNDLYFETAPGKWQKPHLIIPPVDPVNSYWNHHEDPTTQDEMLFFAPL